MIMSRLQTTIIIIYWSFCWQNTRWTEFISTRYYRMITTDYLFSQFHILILIVWHNKNCLLMILPIFLPTSGKDCLTLSDPEQALMLHFHFGTAILRSSVLFKFWQYFTTLPLSQTVLNRFFVLFQCHTYST